MIRSLIYYFLGSTINKNKEQLLSAEFEVMNVEGSNKSLWNNLNQLQECSNLIKVNDTQKAEKNIKKWEINIKQSLLDLSKDFCELNKSTLKYKHLTMIDQEDYYQFMEKLNLINFGDSNRKNDEIIENISRVTNFNWFISLISLYLSTKISKSPKNINSLQISYLFK